MFEQFQKVIYGSVIIILISLSIIFFCVFGFFEVTFKWIKDNIFKYILYLDDKYGENINGVRKYVERIRKARSS